MEKEKSLSKLVNTLKTENQELRTRICWYECKDFATKYPKFYEKMKQNTLLNYYCIF
jgi:hypothetical protein